MPRFMWFDNCLHPREEEEDFTITKRIRKNYKAEEENISLPTQLSALYLSRSQLTQHSNTFSSIKPSDLISQERETNIPVIGDSFINQAQYKGKKISPYHLALQYHESQILQVLNQLHVGIKT